MIHLKIYRMSEYPRLRFCQLTAIVTVRVTNFVLYCIVLDIPTYIT